MTAIRWSSTSLCMILLFLLWVSPGPSTSTAFLAAMFAATFAVVCWTYGAFERNRS